MPTEMRQQHGTTRRGRLQRLLAASACVGFCLAAAACSSQPGTVIGTRSGPAASSGGATSPDGALAAIFSRLDGQLAEADAVPDMHPAALSPQSPEYLNLQPVVVAERMRALNALGASLIDHRQQKLAATRQEVNLLHDLTDAQRLPILADIDSAAATLSALQSKITADPFPDALRADVQTIIDLHILDFVDPKAHLVAAGNVLLTAAQHLTGDATRLRDRINKNGSLSGDPAHDLALLDDLQSKVQSASTSAGTTLSTLGGLQASGFPDNGPALVAAQHAIQLARGTLVSAESNALAVRGDAR